MPRSFLAIGAACMAAAAPAPSMAEDARADAGLRERLELRINGLSSHLGPDTDGLDETNVGLGAAYRLRALSSRWPLVDGADLYLEADAYEDSFSRFAYLFGASARKPAARWLDVGLFAGLIHEDNLVDKYGLYLHPIAYPFAQTRFGGAVDFRISYVPPVRNGGLLVLQMSLGFD